MSRSIDPAWAMDQKKAGPKALPHLFVIMMENTRYETLIGNPNAPWINAAVSLYGVATHYYGISHPSQPNYIAATSGSTHGVTDNGDVTLDVRNLVDQMEEAGKTWRDYQQSLSLCGGNKLAGACGNRQYVRKHNPFVSYRDVQTNPARMAHIVDLSALDADLASGDVADFSWISPDQCNDMHGHPGPKSDRCSYDNRPQLISSGDAFLKSWVEKIMASKAWTENSVIFITWDESEASTKESTPGCCNGDPGGGHVLMLVISHTPPPSRRSDTVYNHYSLLATIEERWGLGCLANTCGPDVARMFDLINRSH
ncbi:MAG: hypothetical protein HY282_15160 [Nitrospirae bacterium]|nr:hypothetical protein [Candidatus Manganitrophaceae bacterium]